MVHDAEVPPADPQKEGRGGLKDYNEKGYVTLADERSGSRTAEYSYDDFAISEVACGLGKTKEAIAQWQTSLKEYQTGSQADTDPEEVAKVSKKLDEARVRLAQETRKK